MTEIKLDPGTTWFTSDTHFGHARIIELCYRLFADVDDMNDSLVRQWNALVKPDDTVVHLGDIAMGKRSETLEYVKRLNGHKLLVPGNHDKVWNGHKKVKASDVQMYEDAGLTILPETLQVELGDKTLLMSHMPYSGDHTAEERYLEWRPEDTGLVLIHGHVHDMWKIRGRQINVGVDVWDFAPVSAMDLLKVVDDMPALVGSS